MRENCSAVQRVELPAQRLRAPQISSGRAVTVPAPTNKFPTNAMKLMKDPPGGKVPRSSSPPLQRVVGWLLVAMDNRPAFGEELCPLR